MKSGLRRSLALALGLCTLTVGASAASVTFRDVLQATGDIPTSPRPPPTGWSPAWETGGTALSKSCPTPTLSP